MEVQHMNLSARERQALRSIEARLAQSSPDLVAKLAKLSRLMVDQDTPAAERSRVSWRQIVVSALVRWLPRSRGRGHTRRQSRLVPALLALWLAVSCALIVTAASLSHVTPAGACGALVAARPHCGTQSPAGPALPGVR
jgi:hypothetical protein